MVRRVTRILNEPARVARRPRLHWLAIPVTLVAVAAPRVTATQLPAAAVVTPAVAAVLSAARVENAEEQRESQRESTAAEIAAARAQLRVIPLPSSRRFARGALARRAGGRRQAAPHRFLDRLHLQHADARRRSRDQRYERRLHRVVGWAHLHGRSAPDRSVQPVRSGDAGGREPRRAAALSRRARGRDRSRAATAASPLGFDFGRTPVFWLGDAPESQSFERVQSLFGQARIEKIQVLLIELASLHSNTNVVLPFLARLVEPSWPPEIRSEAAEGFDHHHDPRSVEILLRVARTDPDSSVRAEAAETIGEVQTPQSIPALTDLVEPVHGSRRAPRSRRSVCRASPRSARCRRIERVIATSEHDDVLNEAVEAIGELDDPAALPLLVQTANTHPNRRAQQEAVETLGDLDAPGVVDALTRIAWEHQTWPSSARRSRRWAIAVTMPARWRRSSASRASTIARRSRPRRSKPSPTSGAVDPSVGPGAGRLRPERADPPGGA